VSMKEVRGKQVSNKQATLKLLNNMQVSNKYGTI